jgi:ribonuclease P protein component
MFSKKKRVTKDVFQTIMKQGGTLSGSLFIFRYIPSKTPAFAIVAPKTVAKQAHLRNKLRRQGYASLRKYPLKPCSGIFFYKKGQLDRSITAISTDIGTILSKIRL